MAIILEDDRKSVMFGTGLLRDLKQCAIVLTSGKGPEWIETWLGDVWMPESSSHTFISWTEYQWGILGFFMCLKMSPSFSESVCKLAHLQPAPGCPLSAATTEWCFQTAEGALSGSDRCLHLSSAAKAPKLEVEERSLDMSLKLPSQQACDPCDETPTRNEFNLGRTWSDTWLFIFKKR